MWFWGGRGGFRSIMELIVEVMVEVVLEGLVVEVMVILVVEDDAGACGGMMGVIGRWCWEWW